MSDQAGSIVATVRTYQAPKEVEINPGIYDISIQALAMNGMETYTEIKNVTVNSGKTTPVEYSFKTGNLVVESLAAGKSFDSAVSIKDAVSGKNVADGRTYGREKDFLLNPGKYEVKLVPLGEYKNLQTQTITVDVVQNDTTIRKINF